MPGLIGIAIQGLLAALGAAPTSPSNDQVELCVPMPADIAHLHSTDLAGLKEHARFYLEKVYERRQRAGDHGLLAFAENAESAAAAMATSDVQPVSGLVGNTVAYFPHKLSLQQASRPVAAAHHLLNLMAPGNAGAAVDDLTQDADTAASGLRQLRNFDDILLRLLAAHAAAARVPGTTVAEVLALYRTEGNLGVPRSAGSLDHFIPPVRHDDLEKTSIARKPNLSQLVWLVDADRYSSEEEAKSACVMDWLLQLAGLDMVEIRAGSLANLKSAFGDWSSSNWQANLGSDPAYLPAAREEVWQELVDDMEARLVGRDGDSRLQSYPFAGASPAVDPFFLRIAPRNPEKLMTTALTEAILYYRHLGQAGALLARENPYDLTTPAEDLPDGHSPPGWVIPPGLAYASYNLQWGHLYPVPMPREGMIVSALGHAYKFTSTTYKSLRDAIDSDDSFQVAMSDLVYQLKKGKYRSGEKADNSAVGLYRVYWPDVRAWLRDAQHGQARIRLTSEFVETAGTALWRSWNGRINTETKKREGSIRGNLNRFHLNWDYYHRVTGESRPD